MEVSAYLRDFERSMLSYSGDDPLDPWDRLVRFVESRLVEEEQRGDLQVVLLRLVHSFLQDERYRDDPRYLSHCVSCAELQSDPAALYHLLHGHGVGTRWAPLYVHWARALEQKQMFPQARGVLERALEKQATPPDILLQTYRLLLDRNATNTHSTPADPCRQPLQNSQLINQSLAQRDVTQPQRKDPDPAASPGPRYQIIVSRSENNPSRSSGGSSVPGRSMYCVEALQCEESELSFEELRARVYYTHQQQRQRVEEMRRLRQEEEEVQRMKQLLDDLEQSSCGGGVTGWREEPGRTPQHHAVASDDDCGDPDASCRGLNHSHITPNTSLGLFHTPSRVLPSPTVNTREALDVIMDMFQAPTLLQEDTFSQAPPSPAPGSAPFTIFQDVEQQQQEEEPGRTRTTESRALRDVPLCRAEVVSGASESSVWGRGSVSLGHTRDFGPSAQLVSTPLHPQPPLCWDTPIGASEPMRSGCPPSSGACDWSTEEEAGPDASDRSHFLRQPKKLSPIMEQSPAEETTPCSLITQSPEEAEPRGVAMSSKPSWTEPHSPEGAEQPHFLFPHPAGDTPGSGVEAELVLRGCCAADVGAEPVSDPWDERLITSLLLKLQPPLSSHARLTTWSRALPPIRPKATLHLGGETLHVDFILGQGAFATVYQATNLKTSQKLCLKVQQPGNPWEFYMDCQLTERVNPGVRHLFGQLHTGHIFSNGSVLSGELHGCGTLLNVVNLYRSGVEKLMPPALVLYFSVCILHMVEQLHQARIIHADIKPDNFLLGERFLESDCSELEGVHHGLALVDLGRSIDMTLFPEGTTFTARCMTSGFQCVEMLSGRPWTYQTDYFGVAGTVFCLMFGSYMRVTREDCAWRTTHSFRRVVHADLWRDFFHTLLNVPHCGATPCLRRLRLQLLAVLQQNYSGKLQALKNRLVVRLLESRPSRR